MASAEFTTPGTYSWTAPSIPAGITLTDGWTNDIRYVDSVNGSNSNNGLTQGSAWQTYNYAHTQIVNITTPVMLVILPGVYTTTSISIGDGYTETLFWDNGKERVYACLPGEVRFVWTAAGGIRDCPIGQFTNANSKLIGAIVERNNNGRTDNYAVSMFRGNGTGHRGSYLNCVFRETNANGNWSLHYDNNNNMPITINQCVFYTTKNAASSYSGGAGMVITNCVFTHDDSSSIATTNTLFNTPVTLPTYVTASATNQGVYYGTYSWNNNYVNVSSGPYEVSVVAIGGGGSGGAAYWAGGGGGGGGLGWKNNISVTPGQSYTVVVGAGGVGVTANSGGQGTAGGDSYFINTSTVAGLGGAAGVGTSSNDNLVYAGGAGGGYVGNGGGTGGTGGSSSGDIAGGGGGAGGYTGNGGSGGTTPTAGSGGAAAGGLSGVNFAFPGSAGSGGGVGINGEGISGTGPGAGGSGGAHGSATGTVGGSTNTGGAYGGGGGGQSNDAKTTPGCNGGGGAVKIFWPSADFLFPAGTASALLLGVITPTFNTVRLGSRVRTGLLSSVTVLDAYRGSTFSYELFIVTSGSFQRWSDS